MFNLRYFFAEIRDQIFFDSFNNTLSRTGKIYPPYYVLWDCTRKCNLHCAHCGATKEKYSEELTEPQIKKIIDELAELRVGFFAVTGGEPLLRTDLLSILSYAKTKGIDTGIATNGFFIDAAMASKIKEAGVSSVQISLDGPEETHNKIRGNSQSYQKAINAIKLLKERNVPIVSVATTVTPGNINELEKLLKILLELNVRLWRITVVMPIGRAQTKKLLLAPAELKKLFEFVKSSNKGKLIIKIGENLPFLAEYETRIRSEPLVCTIGFTACCIGVDGNVRGCPEQPDIPKYREGSAIEKPFLEIWKNGFRRYRSRSIIEADPKCAACKSKYSCFGGCWVMREGNMHCIYELLK
ncbi:MAG: radical SAM protein [Candidatus Diapherotrites archaeon]|nr:radical SAM protein [Candidatus Diapherotrites archaeon]